MIELGKYNLLKVLRQAAEGHYLGDADGEEVLLSKIYDLPEADENGLVSVFIHNDNDGHKVATSLNPKFVAGEFAWLRVKAVAEGVGAFLEWGVDKDLMVPFREQKLRMEADRNYLVYLDIDLETNRLYGSSKVEHFIHNEVLSVEENEEVDLIIWKKTDLGYATIINHIHQGLIYENEVFKDLHVGDSLKGYIKNIREDNKIDLSLQALGYANFIDANAQKVLDMLDQNEGFMAVSDKSTPDEIAYLFGMSKKAFKKAIGFLYKQQIITIDDKGILRS